MSEKLIEILTKVGFEEEKLKAEEINTDELIQEFQKAQRELIANDPSFLDPIKETVTKNASIVATKKAKKALNEKFGLGLSNTELDEKEYGDLLEIVNERSKSSSTTEVNTLNEQIIALTNKLKETEEGAEAKVQEILKRSTEEKHELKRNELLTTAISNLKLIISPEKALKILKVDMADSNMAIAFKEDGTPFIKQGEYEALTADRTGKLTINQMAVTALNDFIQKSNGKPEDKDKRSEAEDLSKLPQPMRERLEQMREAVR